MRGEAVKWLEEAIIMFEEKQDIMDTIEEGNSN